MTHDGRQDARPHEEPRTGLPADEVARPARAFARRIDCAAADADGVGRAGNSATRGAGVQRDDARNPVGRPPRAH